MGEQFQIYPQNIGGGDFAHREHNPPPKWQLHAGCGGHSCHRSVQALTSMLCHAPSMGSCSHFCLILHPHRVAVLFPPTFASPWRNSFLQIHGEQLCSRQNLGPPLKNDTKTTKIWGWGHLMVQINPPPGCLRFPMKIDLQKLAKSEAIVIIQVD